MSAHFDKVWINNLSTSTVKPLLTMTITIPEDVFKKNPLHIVERHEEEQNRYLLVLSFLEPEDLELLQNAIDIAKQGKLDNEKMMAIFKEQQDNTALYAVGIHHGTGDFGMIYGPNTELKDMLTIDPSIAVSKDDYSKYDMYILKFTKDTTKGKPDVISQEIYIWNKKLAEWQEI